MTKTAAPKKKNSTKSDTAGLIFPVRRVEKSMKKTHGLRMGNVAAVKATAAAEFYIRKIIEKSVAAAAGKKRTRISTFHITHAIREDPELQALTRGLSIAESGMMGHIFPHNKKTNKQQQTQRRRERKRQERENQNDEDDESDEASELGSGDEAESSEEAGAPVAKKAAAPARKSGQAKKAGAAKKSVQAKKK
jgi:histone H3/H4